MNYILREELIYTLLRFKKMNMCFPEKNSIQLGELMVMGKISKCCCEENDRIHVSDIQHQLHISKPAVSQILNALEKKGFVVREIDMDDRRRISVRDTLKGKAALKETKECYDKILDEMISQFGAQRLETLIEQLNQLVDIFEKLNTGVGNYK